MNSKSPEAVLDRAHCLLFGFNGPICDLFTEEHPVRHATDVMRSVLTKHGAQLPPEIITEQDPLNILRFAATLGRPTLLCKVENALCTAEVTAVRMAKPAPHAHRSIIAAQTSGRRIGIVSNASANAINTYLTAHNLYDLVFPIVGRAFGDPGILKPHPSAIIWAMHQLKARRRDCALIGNSPADVAAARSAGIPIVSYIDSLLALPGRTAGART